MSDDEDITGDIEALKDFCGLRTRDWHSRGQFLETLGRTIKAWKQREENGYDKLLEGVLPGILRLSTRCPFLDVRDKCSEILTNIKVGHGQPLGQLYFRNAHVDLALCVFNRPRDLRFPELSTRVLRALFLQER